MSIEPPLLSLSDFDFTVPPHLIAQTPPAARDGSRLIMRSATGKISHRMVTDLLTEIPPQSLLVLNNSKVLPSRLLGKTAHGGRVELMLLSEYGERAEEKTHWWAIGKPMRKFRHGTILYFAADLQAEIVEHQSSSELQPMLVRFNRDPSSFLEWAMTYGYVPLPPYISRENPKPAKDSDDTQRYQTVYAKSLGSVAAPTAGLHFTPELLSALTERGIKIAEITLHVGAATFLPVRSQDISLHKMHEEAYLVGGDTLKTILDAKNAGHPIIAVGTTTLRCLESFFRASQDNQKWLLENAHKWHRTKLFLRPQFRNDRVKIQTADGLITNFHQPQSTLFMLISGLIGLQEAKELYGEAVKEKYRFFSYGDACLLWI